MERQIVCRGRSPCEARMKQQVQQAQIKPRLRIRLLPVRRAAPLRAGQSDWGPGDDLQTLQPTV